MTLMLVRSLFEAFNSHQEAARSWIDPNHGHYYGCGPHHNKMADALVALIASHGYVIVYDGLSSDVRFDVALAEKNNIPECFWPEGALAEYEEEMAAHYAAADAFDSADVEWNDVTTPGTYFDEVVRAIEGGV